MMNIVNIYKPTGLTPLQLIKNFKEKYPKYQDRKIAYAGRLDPLAHGVMILLIEPETKNAKQYQNLDKEYEFDVLFGTSTDTYDVLGKILRQAQDDKADLTILPALSTVRNNIETFVGKHQQPYPPFSSKTVNGKPLFWWAREERLDEIEIPKKEIEIYDIKLTKIYEVKKRKLNQLVIKKIELVKGDFRQNQILDSWKAFFKKTSYKKFTVAKIKVSCSSGTYVRLIAHNLGKKLGCDALALEILRTKVGKYTLKGSMRI